MRLLQTLMLNIVNAKSFKPEQLDRAIDADTLAGAQASS